MYYFVCVKFMSDGISYSNDIWQKQLLPCNETDSISTPKNFGFPEQESIYENNAELRHLYYFQKLCVKEATIRSKQNLFEFIKHNMGSSFVGSVLNKIRKMQNCLVAIQPVLLAGVIVFPIPTKDSTHADKPRKYQFVWPFYWNKERMFFLFCFF